MYSDKFEISISLMVIKVEYMQYFAVCCPTILSFLLISVRILSEVTDWRSVKPILLTLQNPLRDEEGEVVHLTCSQVSVVVNVLDHLVSHLSRTHNVK